MKVTEYELWASRLWEYVDFVVGYSILLRSVCCFHCQAFEFFCQV